MSSRRPPISPMVPEWLGGARRVLVLLVVAAAVVGACSHDSPGPTVGGGNTGNPSFVDQGKPCSTDGETRDCGRVEHREGNYVTCSVGQATCTKGKWGPCVGDRIVTKTLPNVRLGMDGLRLLAGPTSPACTNVCDPYCITVQPDPHDVDASTIAHTADGGLTLVRDAATGPPPGGNCTGLQCQIVRCSNGNSTKLSGTVYDPAGNNPLYDAHVYIPLDPTAALPSFKSGATCDTCGGASSLEALQATTTDASGNFTLTNVPSGTDIPVVVQMGKWRREILLKKVDDCVDNKVTGNCTTPNPADCVFRLPKNQADGYDPVAKTYDKADMPKTAIITGSADPFDCLLLKAGIDPQEVSDYDTGKAIHYFYSDTKAGNHLDPNYGADVPGSSLWKYLDNHNPNMLEYDVILLPCEGGAIDRGSATPYQNLISYANSGGRVFMTHFSYSWIEYPAGKSYVTGDNWSTIANWAPTGTGMTSSINTQDPLTGIVDTSFPKGGTFSSWLQNVNATVVPSRLTIHEGRQDLISIGTGAQQWMTANDLMYGPSPNYTNLFTFNTPVTAASDQQCGRAVFSDFHVSAKALTSSGACVQDKDCGFTDYCSGSTPGVTGQCSEPCATASDCPNSGFSCNGAATGTCAQTACTKDSNCGSGRYCKSGACACLNDADCNGGSCTSKTCSQIACSSSAQCGSGTCGGGTCNILGCHKNADCGLGTCGTVTGGTCSGGATCHTNTDCGTNGSCGAGTGSTQGTCGTGGTTICHANSDCDSNSCGAGTGATAGACSTNATVCHRNSDCDSGSCGSGTGSTTGVCGHSTAYACHSNADCDSGSCGSGTGSTAGTCSIIAGTACHTNADCDGTCGSGTGSTAGTCGHTTGYVCHSNADCDSGSCGSGTGSAAGTCNTSAAACHKNADCDSNSCGVGTGSTTGTCGHTTGFVCHKNADCDSNSCGVGTGSTAGSCNTSAAVCHKNADCDSGACGSGTGSALGICTAGACTANAQCGTGGTCNLVTHLCTAGSCASDAVCGTSGGICTGAKCSNKACAIDTACGVSGLCNNAKCSTAAACTSDAACTSSGLCTGAKCSTLACTSDAACGVSALCNNAKCSTAATCAGDGACPSSRVCTGAKCSTLACTSDAACGTSHLCNNAKCSTAAACTSDAGCPSSLACTGAKCSNAACAGDAACTVSHLCNNAKCSTPAKCSGDSGCPVSHLCTGAKCSSTATCKIDTDCPMIGAAAGVCNNSKCAPPPSCGQKSDCGTSASAACTGAKCSAVPCSTNADCATGSICGGSCTTATCTSDADCAAKGGTCTGGVCGCLTAENCGGSQSCGGVTQGSCKRSCTSDADCAPDKCNNGTCGGCASDSDCHDNLTTATCTGIPAGNFGTCANYTPGYFPEACKQGTLSPQEKALEFMFFDLTSCVSPDNLPPPPPVATYIYPPGQFTETFTASCPPNTAPAWREFDWQASIPATASIVFSAQTGDSITSLRPSTPVVLATATTSTNTGAMNSNYDVALIETGQGGTGAFDLTNPYTRSGNILRVLIQMNPTTTQLAAPTLKQWKVQYDCVPSQ